MRSLLRRILGLLILLALWHLLTIFFPPLVVPPITQVIRKLASSIGEKKFAQIILTTITRFVAGLLIGVAMGSVLGVIFGLSRRVEELFSPYISILQAVPPVCWVVLALVWFGFNGKPCVFIVATASIPTMVLNLSKGIHNIDPEL